MRNAVPRHVTELGVKHGDVKSIGIEKPVHHLPREGSVAQELSGRDVPIFILIDNFTASASEILAGTLRYHAEKEEKNKNLLVFLVGTETFGKGSVQELIPLKSGCALKITSMLYFLPDHSSIQATGIKPDFVIKPKVEPSEELKWINDLYGKETSLKHHIPHKETIFPKKEDAEHNKNDKSKKEEGLWSKIVNAVTGKEDENQEKKSEKNKDTEEKEKTWYEKQQEMIASNIQIQSCINMINMLNLKKEYDADGVNTRKKALEFLKTFYISDEIEGLERVK